MKMKSRSRDHKGTLIGQKHTLNDALRQTKECINNLKRELLGNSDIELGQDANAAEVLDLDRTEGMRSETIIGNSRNSWKNAPLNLLKIIVNTPFVFDYLKFEVIRAEINYGIKKKESLVLWEEKFKISDISKLGLISGILSEVVNLGAMRSLTNGQISPKNEWSIELDHVYISGFLEETDLEVITSAK